jgi:hypothetical protein
MFGLFQEEAADEGMLKTYKKCDHRVFEEA